MNYIEIVPKKRFAWHSQRKRPLEKGATIIYVKFERRDPMMGVQKVTLLQKSYLLGGKWPGKPPNRGRKFHVSHDWLLVPPNNHGKLKKTPDVFKT